MDETLSYVEQLKERDPLAVLQEGTFVGGEKGGQFNLLKLAPNFEMAMREWNHSEVYRKTIVLMAQRLGGV